MKAPQLETENAHIRLVEPDVERDSRLGVQWLNGDLGRVTMQLMGNTGDVIDKMLPTTVELESERVRDFIERKDQLNWMIEYEGKVVGSVWVDLDDSDDLPGPSVHIMIGDPTMRGKGVGGLVVGTVLEYLETQGNDVIYSRHLTTNEGSDKLLKSLGFDDLDGPYISDTLEFQNVVRKVDQ